MFLRDKKHKRKDGTLRVYLQIAESYREGGKVKQRVKGTLGRLDKLKESGDLESIAEQMAKYAENAFLVVAPEKDVKIEWSKQYGVVYVFDWLWKRLGLKDIVLELLSDRKFGFDVERAIFTMVVNRLIDPRSKLGEVEWLHEVHIPGTDGLKEQHLYRAMDFLYESNEILQEKVFRKTVQLELFKPEADIVLCDTTCIRYDGEGKRAEGLIEVGRPNNGVSGPRAVLGLATTRDGIPIGYEVFRGSISDQETLKEVLAKMEARFRIKGVIFVIDRGMSCVKNIELLSKYEYIAGMRMRKFKEVSNDVLQRPGRYKKVRDNLFVKEVMVGDKRYIVAYNPIEAKRDKEARDALISGVEGKNLKSLIKSPMYKRFLKIEGNRINIDMEKVRRDARYDGKYVILTNVKELSSDEVVLQYKNLLRVEDSFRELKSTIEIEPMRHFTPPRIETHIMICVLALFLERVFEKLLRDSGLDITARKGMQELRALSLSKVELRGRSFLVRSECSQLVVQICKALKIRIPERINKE